MSAAVMALVCGCPAAYHEANGHRPGCWMGEAEAIAAEAFEAFQLATVNRRSGSVLTLVSQALVEAGYLREPGTETELLQLLDSLADVGLLTHPLAHPAQDGE